MVKDNGLYDFTITKEQKEVRLMVCGKVLAEAEKAGDQDHPGIVAMVTLTEKLLDTMDESDLELTREEMAAINGVDVLIRAIMTDRDPMEVAKEYYGR